MESMLNGIHPLFKFDKDKDSEDKGKVSVQCCLTRSLKDTRREEDTGQFIV